MWTLAILPDRNRLMRLLGRAFVLAAFWVPLLICTSVAVTPDPTGMVASLSGQIAHILAFAYLTTALFQAHFRWRRAAPPAERVLASETTDGDRAPVGSAEAAASSGVASPAQCVLAAVLWMLAFGVSIEVAQIFVAGRNGTLADLLFNGVGIAIGCVAQSGLAWVASRPVGMRGLFTRLGGADLKRHGNAKLQPIE